MPTIIDPSAQAPSPLQAMFANIADDFRRRTPQPAQNAPMVARPSPTGTLNSYRDQLPAYNVARDVPPTPEAVEAFRRETRQRTAGYLQSYRNTYGDRPASYGVVPINQDMVDAWRAP
jgi:hypothetical protein